MGAKMTDKDLFIQAGIDPKTGLPLRLVGPQGATDIRLKDDITRVLRIVDEQDAVNRYTWYNLPSGLTSQLLERMMYYKGQLMFFYIPTDEKFYMLPYALDGNIDVYGKFLQVTPLPYKGGMTDSQGKQLPWISGLVRTPVYEMPLEEDEIDIENSCVILKDYTPQNSETIIPRQILNDPVVIAESEAFPLARTNLINNCGVEGLRVNDQDASAQVEYANNALVNAALNGRKYIPTVSQVEMQELSATSALKSEEYLMYMEALDNFRLSLYGLGNGGIFQKKAHMLGAEQQMNTQNTGRILQDGLTLRQNFCDIVNAIWGLGIWCEVSETATGMDYNMDGEIQNDKDQSGTMAGEQPEEVA